MLHIDEQSGLDWDETEVARRWTRLFTGPAVVRAFAAGQELSLAQRQVALNHIAEYRKRLADLSWFMKCLNEPIARQANAEDNVTGHFWQSRFTSQALLDEAAVLTAMAYVDLNPIRAGIAETPEASDYTSIQQRIAAWRAKQTPAQRQKPEERSTDTEDLSDDIVRLLSFRDESSERPKDAIAYSTADYLELVDWSGRAIIEGKKGSIPEHLPPILKRLNMRPDQYLAYIRKPRFGFANALGALDKVKAYAEHFEKAFMKGQTAAAALFSPGR